MTKITDEMSIEFDSGEPDQCVIDLKSEIKKPLKKSRGEPTPCPICGVIICNRYNLSCHLRRHNNDKPYRCDECNKAFILPAELKRHKVIHSKDSPFKCTVCSKGFKCIESLRLHFDNHGLNEYKCRYCELVFKKNRIRGSHEKNFHNKSVLKCKYCYKTFSESRYKEQHETEVHVKKIKPDPDSESCETRVIEVNSYGIKVETLKRSGRQQTRPRRQVHRQNNVERCVKRFDSDFKFYACKFCSERFKFRKEQISHYQNLHQEEFDKVFVICEECGKLLTKKHFSSHMQAHAGDCPFECDTCDYKSARKYDLLNHMLVHTKEYRFKCAQCQKPFRSKASALVCEKKHTGKKEVKCNSCDMTFYSVVDLRSHVVAKHKLRKCEICGYETTVKYSYDKHRELHHKSNLSSKSLICEKCGTLYASQKNLIKHLRTHHSEKPSNSEYKKQHVCYYCDYQGVSSSDILNHCVENHLSKVYKCEICMYLTLKTNHFINHMKHHIQDSAHEMYICSTLDREDEKLLHSYSLECFMCGFSSIHKNVMNEHIEFHNENFKTFKWYRSNSFYKALKSSDNEPESDVDDDTNETVEINDTKFPINLCKISLDDSSDFENIDFKVEYKNEKKQSYNEWFEGNTDNESIVILHDIKEEIVPERSLKIENLW